MAEYLVGVEQTRPYEWVTLEIFREKADALDYASRFADGHGYIQVSKRRWRYCEDDKQHLIVLKRSW